MKDPDEVRGTHDALVNMGAPSCLAAVTLLDEIGYGRLAAYASFLADAPNVPASCKTHREIAALIELDRSLRPPLMGAIDIVETQFKAQYSRAMADAHGPCCLGDPSCFKRTYELKRTLFVLRNDLRVQTGVDPAKAFAACAHEGADGQNGPRGSSIASYWSHIPFSDAIDAASLKTAARLFANTRDIAIQQRVADSFGTDPRHLLSWIRALAAVRNCCAHFQPYAILPQAPVVPTRIDSHTIDALPPTDSHTPISQAHPDDNTAPLYIALVLERLLQGRASYFANGTRAVCDFQRFRDETTRLLGRFAHERPQLADALRIPQSIANRYAASAESAQPATMQSAIAWSAPQGAGTTQRLVSI